MHSMRDEDALASVMPAKVFGKQEALEAYAHALEAEYDIWTRVRHMLHEPDLHERWMTARLRTDLAREVWKQFGGLD